MINDYRILEAGRGLASAKVSRLQRLGVEMRLLIFEHSILMMGD